MAGPGSCATGAAVCIAAEQARAFVDGRLAPAERAAVQHRIDACQRCRAAIADAARDGSPARTAVQRPAAAQPGGEHPGTPAWDALSTRRDGPAAGRRDVPGPATPRDAPDPAPQGAAPRTAAYMSPSARREAARAAGVGIAPTSPATPVMPPGASGELAAGEVVGRYVVERALGAGGMGVVSLARDPELRRAVVIKLVHPNMGHGEGGDELEARLRREAQAMAQVSHANVVQIFDIGRRGDRVFLAMEFVAGRTFDVWLLERPRTPDEILAMIRQAGAGLAAAHRAGLVHRDFKPSNVLVGNDDVVKVTDFGLARSFTGAQVSVPPGAFVTRQLRAPRPGEPVREPAPAGASRSAPRTSGVHAVLTEADSVVGTPAYMAPEQAAGHAIDARTDQYALAVTLLDALLAQSPVRRAVKPGAPPAEIDAALERAGIADPVRAAILRALSEDPAARFPTIDELLRALAPPPPRRSRARWLAIAGIALCAAAGLAWFAVQRTEQPVCIAAAPARWLGEPRARVVAALSAAPRPFAGWDAERVASALDTAVDALAAAELARCQGSPLAGPAGTSDCITRRTTALGNALAALSGSPPPAPEDAWRVVRSVEQCEPPPDPSAALRGELAGASPARAREIASLARKSGDDRLVAAALEAAGLAALAAGDATAADADLRAMSGAGERSGDDATRGRALLHLLEAGRWRGEYSIAKRDLDELHAMLARHRDAPRDQLTVALAEGAAFADLGDVATSFAAWDRALAAAAALGDRDAALTAQLGRAWSTHVLRFDLAGARAQATAALADAAGATPAVRAAALAVAADLAIAAGDGTAALSALAEAHRLVPARASQFPDRVRILRGRALTGSFDDALDGLVASASDDPLTAARIAIARGRGLLAAGRIGEAREAFESVERDVRGYGKSLAAVPMPVPERIELSITTCEAQLAELRTCKASFLRDELIKTLHPRAPARARLIIAEADSDTVRPFKSVRSRHLSTALEILVDAGAHPLRIAELRWQIAQLGYGMLDHRALATAARDAFQAGGRSAEVTAIDAWLAEQPATPDGSGARPVPPPRDPRGPQP